MSACCDIGILPESDGLLVVGFLVVDVVVVVGFLVVVVEVVVVAAGHHVCIVVGVVAAGVQLGHVVDVCWS